MLIKKIQQKIRWYKKRRGLLKEIQRRGGDHERLQRRRERQYKIRKEKSNIIMGLLRSWDLKEIKPPSRELYDNLQWFHHGLTIKYLRKLEKEFWS